MKGVDWGGVDEIYQMALPGKGLSYRFAGELLRSQEHHSACMKSWPNML
jgi:hypothetical protein